MTFIITYSPGRSRSVRSSILIHRCLTRFTAALPIVGVS